MPNLLWIFMVPIRWHPIHFYFIFLFFHPQVKFLQEPSVDATPLHCCHVTMLQLLKCYNSFSILIHTLTGKVNRAAVKINSTICLGDLTHHFYCNMEKTKLKFQNISVTLHIWSEILSVSSASIDMNKHRTDPLKMWMRSVLYLRGVSSALRTCRASRTFPSSRYSRYFCCSSRNFIRCTDRHTEDKTKKDKRY